jgi:hypothetical protein
MNNILAILSIPDHNIVLTIFDYPSYKGTGILQRSYYKYSMTLHGVELFSGDDYSPSPMDSAESLDSLLGLLSFLTVRPGDTEEEYFKDYTPLQLEFCNSYLCEELQSLPYDRENGEFHNYYNVTYNIVSNDNLLYENYTVTNEVK